MQVILASASPRRKELLSQLGVEFEIITSDVDEVLLPKGNYKKQSMHLSTIKAEDVFNKTKNKGDRIVIGSDTMVVYKGELLGKPKDEKDAFNMLKMLSGKTHKVVSGLCVIVERNKVVTRYILCDYASVKFDHLKDDAIKYYISTGEPMDKAGAYAIQGGAAKFVKYIHGNNSTIIGLPVHRLYNILNKEGIVK